jgi:hypothetical protein
MTESIDQFLNAVAELNERCGHNHKPVSTTASRNTRAPGALSGRSSWRISVLPACPSYTRSSASPSPTRTREAIRPSDGTLQYDGLTACLARVSS